MLLSIVIPTYNRCILLREAIASVIDQQLTSLEIIVCDDGSTEDMSAARDSLLHTQHQVRWSRTEESHGAQVARNRGLALAQGDAVLFLDSDDVLADSGVSSLLQALEDDSTLDYVYGKVIRTDEHLTPLIGISPVGAPFENCPVEMAGYHWHTMGAIYRKSYLEKVGGWNEALTGSQDWEYQARVKLIGGRGRFIDVVVGYWREHGGSRVGAKAFRADYVRSVMLACDSILQQARKAGRGNNALEQRIAKKLIVHALEWGANGEHLERKRCLAQAANTLSDASLLRLGINLLQFSPASMDARLWSLLVKRGN